MDVNEVNIHNHSALCLLQSFLATIIPSNKHILELDKCSKHHSKRATAHHDHQPHYSMSNCEKLSSSSSGS